MPDRPVKPNAESVWLHCPTCATVIDPSQRCVAERGPAQCVENQGHHGWHWSETGHPKGVLRWTGHFSTYSCGAHLTLDNWCRKDRGHEGVHNNGRGVSFGDPKPIPDRPNAGRLLAMPEMRAEMERRMAEAPCTKDPSRRFCADDGTSEVDLMHSECALAVFMEWLNG